MSTPMELFDYALPPHAIAAYSVEPRDSAKLLVLDRGSGERQHKHVFDLPQFLRSGDVLVFNNTKVFKARLHTSDGMELFLLKEISGGIWEALIRGVKRVHRGDLIHLAGAFGPVKLLERRTDGIVVVDMGASRDEVLRYCDSYGEVPIPPYVCKNEKAEDDYQTVYAKEVGAVAAPTAGFHFTARLLDELQAMAVQCEFVTLHVGIGTFRPVQTKTLEEHTMHSEWVSINQETADRINLAKNEGRRVIAVGTTVVRALEGVARIHAISVFYPVGQNTEIVSKLTAYSGNVNLFMTPGFAFTIIDGLITNFHLPKSTLLALVSAFAGRENILSAYEEAKRMSYRFYSFGDAMFIR